MLLGEGGGLAEDAAEAEEDVELIEENGQEAEARGEGEGVGRFLVGDEVEGGPGAEGEDGGGHGDTGVEEQFAQAAAAGEGQQIEMEDDGGEQIGELLDRQGIGGGGGERGEGCGRRV